MDNSLRSAVKMAVVGGVIVFSRMALATPPPELVMLGANGAIVASDENPSSEKGTHFGTYNPRQLPVAFTFIMTNPGPDELTITSVTTNDSTNFTLLSFPASLAQGAVGDVEVRLEKGPFSGGTPHAATFVFTNNGSVTPFNFKVSANIDPDISSVWAPKQDVATVERNVFSRHNWVVRQILEDLRDIALQTNLNAIAARFDSDGVYPPEFTAGDSVGLVGHLTYLFDIYVISNIANNVGYKTFFDEAGGYFTTEYPDLFPPLDFTNTVDLTFYAGRGTAASPLLQAFTNVELVVMGNRYLIHAESGGVTQTVDFAAIPDQDVAGTVGLSAAASSGLPVVFAVTGPATLSGGTNLAFTGTGGVTVVASQPGDRIWYAAPGVTNRFYVTQQPPDAPASVAASDGTYPDKVRVAWNAVSNALTYEVWRNTVNNFGTATKLEPSVATAWFDDMTALNQTTWYYWVKAVNAGGASGFSAPDTGYLAEVGPMITVNGSIGDNVVIAAGTPLTIAVEMMNLPAAYIGHNVDWWVAALMHNGNLWFYLNNAMVFVPFDGDLANMHPAYQGPLMELPPHVITQGLTLAPGTYNVWFAVDYPMDGILHLIPGQYLMSRVTLVVE